MTKRTVTLTEREVAAIRSAMALFGAEHEADEYYYYSPEHRQDLLALERVNTKLAKALNTEIR